MNVKSCAETQMLPENLGNLDKIESNGTGMEEY